MENNFHKAYKEVLQILKYMPKEDIEKVPKEIILTFETKMDKDYKFEIDANKSIEEQVLLEETKDILANLFRDYWATPKQKEKIIEKENQEKRIIEEGKRKKYNPEDVFGNRGEASNEAGVSQEDGDFEKDSTGKIKLGNEKNLKTISNKSWFERFLEFWKSIINKGKK